MHSRRKRATYLSNSRSYFVGYGFQPFVPFGSTWQISRRLKINLLGLGTIFRSKRKPSPCLGDNASPAAGDAQTAATRPEPASGRIARPPSQAEPLPAFGNNLTLTLCVVYSYRAIQPLHVNGRKLPCKTQMISIGASS